MNFSPKACDGMRKEYPHAFSQFVKMLSQEKENFEQAKQAIFNVDIVPLETNGVSVTQSKLNGIEQGSRNEEYERLCQETETRIEIIRDYYLKNAEEIEATEAEKAAQNSGKKNKDKEGEKINAFFKAKISDYCQKYGVGRHEAIKALKEAGQYPLPDSSFEDKYNLYTQLNQKQDEQEGGQEQGSEDNSKEPAKQADLPALA